VSLETFSVLFSLAQVFDEFLTAFVIGLLRGVK